MFKLAQYLKGDRMIWFVLLALALASILAVYSSTYSLTMIAGSNSSLFKYLGRQIFFLFAGFVLIYVLHKIPVRNYRKLAVVGFITGVVLLISMYFYRGENNLRAIRWSWLPVIGEYQPSDVVKVIMVVYLATILDIYEFKTFKDFAIAILLPIALVCGLLIRGGQTTTLIIGSVCTLLILLSGVKRRYVLATFGIVMFFGMTYIFFGGYISPRHGTFKQRITNFFSPQKTDATENLQIKRVKIAVAQGGIIGKGPGNSTQRKLLTEAYNDFIYAIIIEEYGWAGGIIIMLLYLTLFYRVILIIKQCTMKYTMLLMTGLISMLMLQTMVHLGAAVSAIPATGQPLPLISMGGTSTLMTCVSIGLILSVSRALQKNMQNYEL